MDFNRPRSLGSLVTENGSGSRTRVVYSVLFGKRGAGHDYLRETNRFTHGAKGHPSIEFAQVGVMSILTMRGRSQIDSERHF